MKMVFNNGKNFEHDYVKKATRNAVNSAGLNIEKTERTIQGNTVKIAFLNSNNEYIPESQLTKTEKNEFISKMESRGFYHIKNN